MKKVGTVLFDDDLSDYLGPEIAWFVAREIGMDPEDAEVEGSYVYDRLANGTLLPLYEVDVDDFDRKNLGPKEVIRGQDAVERVKKYVWLMQRGAKFPPVLVRRLKKHAGGLELLDGWHRRMAAKIIGRDTIKAIDISKPRLVRRPNGSEVFDFQGHRIP